MADFSYFDQFENMEVNLTPYLESVKENSGFDYTFTNIQSVKVKLADIFTHISIVDQFESDIQNFEFYILDENDRPENVADDYYGDKQYWWLPLIFNRITNVFTQWPLNEAQLNTLAMKMYQTEGLYNQTTYFNLLAEQNEAKRELKLIRPLYAEQVVAAFRKAFEAS